MATIFRFPALWVRLALVAALALVLGLAVVSFRAEAQEQSMLFPQTGKTVKGKFLTYWQEHGGLPQFGYPISDELVERSDLDGNEYTMQYFERAIFELHPENEAPYDVLLSQLGTFRYREKYGSQSGAGAVADGPSMAVKRSVHSSTLLKNGQVLIAGGMITEGDFTTSAELYDPKTGLFTPTGNLTRGRGGHNAVLLQSGKVLLISGDWDDDLDSAEIYDPETELFTPTGNLTTPRSGTVAILLADGRVLVVGGDGDGDMLATAEIYDPETGRFTPTGRMNEGRATPAASLLPDGRVLITGGGADGTVLSSAEIYDPATGEFEAAGSMTLARYKHAQATLADGKVLIAGGSDGRDWRGRYAEAEIYDPETGLFTPTDEMQEERFKLADAVTVLQDSRVLVSGGGSYVEVYRPDEGGFMRAEGSTGDARSYQTTTLLPDGRVLIAGGYDDRIASTERTWIYTP